MNGEKGDTGEQGDAGERGVGGERGDTGQRGVGGERGPKGDHGQSGDTGDKGIRGIPGAAGERGDHGWAGAQGVQGERGARGDTGEQGEQGRNPRRVTLAFVAVVLFSFAVLSTMAWQIKTNRHLVADGRQAHDALCVFKADLAKRAEDGATFLKEHPDGIPGIPAATIAQSLKNQQATLRTLNSLECGSS